MEVLALEGVACGLEVLDELRDLLFPAGDGGGTDAGVASGAGIAHAVALDVLGNLGDEFRGEDRRAAGAGEERSPSVTAAAGRREVSGSPRVHRTHYSAGRRLGRRGAVSRVGGRVAERGSSGEGRFRL